MFFSLCVIVGVGVSGGGRKLSRQNVGRRKLGSAPSVRFWRCVRLYCSRMGSKPEGFHRCGVQLVALEASLWSESAPLFTPHILPLSPQQPSTTSQSEEEMHVDTYMLRFSGLWGCPSESSGPCRFSGTASRGGGTRSQAPRPPAPALLYSNQHLVSCLG